MESEQFIINEQPELRRPDLVAAFAGWPDAAQVATSTVTYMVRKLNATMFAEIGAEEFYDFTTIRPMVSIERGLLSGIKMPTNSFFYWRNPEAEHDLVLLHGIEPQLHWQGYIDLILDLADRLKVVSVYTLGGLYDRVPHTMEPKITAAVNKPELVDVLEKHDIEPIAYHGPSSLHTLLLSALAQRGMDAFSLWGHTPFYVRAETNPMVCSELLYKLTELLEIEVDMEEVTKAGEYLKKTLSRLLEKSDELRFYVQKLEEQYEVEGMAPGGLSEDTEKIVREVEDFLKGERHGGESS